jgi:hypothetical protein
VLPLIYYRPFKAAAHYAAHHFPQWTEETQGESGSFITDFTDKFYYAEKYFNVVKFDDLYETEQAYKDFRAFLTGHCNVYPVPFMTIHNLFTMHYVFYEKKILIQFHLEKLCKPDKKASEMQKLPSQILRLQGWEVLDLDESEFKSWDYNVRISEIQGWLRGALEKQKDKGIIERVPT